MRVFKPNSFHYALNNKIAPFYGFYELIIHKDQLRYVYYLDDYLDLNTEGKTILLL